MQERALQVKRWFLLELPLFMTGIISLSRDIDRNNFLGKRRGLGDILVLSNRSAAYVQKRKKHTQCVRSILALVLSQRLHMLEMWIPMDPLPLKDNLLSLQS